MNYQSFTQSVNSQVFLSVEEIRSFIFDNDMQVPCGASESNKYLAEYAKLIKENNYEETTENLFLPPSSNRLNLDGPVISGINTAGVNERVNRYCSLAISDN